MRTSSHPIRPLRAAALVAAGAATLGLVGCSGDSDEAEGPAGTVTTVVTPASSSSAPSPTSSSAPAPAPAPTDPGPALDRIAAELPEGAGVAVAPVGSPEAARGTGSHTTGPAWSSSKVPLSLAALRANPDVTPAVQSALQSSDNQAAETLWNGLGGGQQAASAVEAILRETGDPTTTVPAERKREGFSVFGQTEWALADQARFGAALPCRADAAEVLEPMTHVDASQQWGLGSLPGAAFKGGWGPLDSGSGYLTRQFGVIPTSHGRVAVAIAIAGPPFEQGTGELTRIAGLVGRELEALPAGECPAR